MGPGRGCCGLSLPRFSHLYEGMWGLYVPSKGLPELGSQGELGVRQTGNHHTADESFGKAP